MTFNEFKVQNFISHRVRIAAETILKQPGEFRISVGDVSIGPSILLTQGADYIPQREETHVNVDALL